MSLTCQYTIMSPTSSSSSASQQPSRLNQRRNALPNVHAGISPEDINLIRVRAPACLNTGTPTCVSTTNSSSMTMSTRSDAAMVGSATEASESGLSALAYQSSSPESSRLSSPLQSPNLRHRRNALPDVLAEVDQGFLRRIRAASQASMSPHDEEDDDHHEFVF